ncbi:MAG: hypothetical protein AAGA02_15365 [Bacteroidota bacterium]
MRCFGKITLILTFLITVRGYAQLHIGITADLGNYVEFSPGAGALLKNPMAPSGSIMFFMKEQIDDHWLLQYGGSLGTLGYWMRSQAEFDTLSAGNDPDFYSWYPNYNTIYSSAHLVFGRSVILPNRLPTLEIMLGGGGTYYFESQVDSRSRGCEVIPCQTVFEYEMARESSSVKRFMELSIQTYVLHQLLIGLRYRQHFEPALRGSYNFYHVVDPPSGKITLTQRAISIICLYEF